MNRRQFWDRALLTLDRMGIGLFYVAMLALLLTIAWERLQ